MRFFLVGTDPASAMLRLITDTVFETRRDALAYLSSESSANALVGLDSEVYVVDLDAATPVLVVPQSAPAAETLGEAVDTPDEIADQAGQADGAEGADEANVVEESVLADALRRATGTLESEGIVAPESVEAAAVDAGTDYPTPFVPEPAAWPWDASAQGADAAETDAAPAEPPATDEVALQPVEEVAQQPAEVLTEEAPNADEEDAAISAEIAALVAEEPVLARVEAETVATYEFDALEEPAVDDTELVPSSAEDPVYGRTVVMGEYTPVEPMGVTEVEDPVESAVSSPGEPEPVADDTYTCDDCVYVNTCPKHHESDPSSCGSFQWKIA